MTHQPSFTQAEFAAKKKGLPPRTIPRAHGRPHPVDEPAGRHRAVLPDGWTRTSTRSIRRGARSSRGSKAGHPGAPANWATAAFAPSPKPTAEGSF